MKFFCVLLLFFFLSLIGILYFWESRHNHNSDHDEKITFSFNTQWENRNAEKLSFLFNAQKEKIRSTSSLKKRTDPKNSYCPPYPPTYSPPLLSNDNKNIPPKQPNIPDDPVDIPAIIRFKRTLRRLEDESDNLETPISPPPINKEKFIKQSKEINIESIEPQSLKTNIFLKTKDVGVNTSPQTEEIGTSTSEEKIPIFKESPEEENPIIPSCQIPLKHPPTIETEYIPITNYLKKGPTVVSELIPVYPSNPSHEAEKKPLFNIDLNKERDNEESPNFIGKIPKSDLKKEIKEIEEDNHPVIERKNIVKNINPLIFDNEKEK